MRILEEFNGAFKGQPAFVIASGTSIAELDLTPLKGQITIAVNSGLLAYSFPRFFLSDDWSCCTWSWFLDNLVKGQSEVLLYEDKLDFAAKIFGDRSVLFRHRFGYHITDTYSHTDKELHICQARTSVGSAMHVAHIMGCDPIVLLGVDCYRNEDGFRYVWQCDPKRFGEPLRFDRRPVDRYRRRDITEEMRSDTDLISILDYWNLHAEEFNKKCTIFNASPKSLVDSFQKIELKQFFAKKLISS